MRSSLGDGVVATPSAEAGARALERLRRVAADPPAELRRIKERPRLMGVGYFDTYLPPELIAAHGVLPFRVPTDGHDDTRAMEYIQGFACPASRNVLDQALRGDLDMLDGALFTRYCDSLRGVFAVWDSEKLTPYVDFVRYPTVTHTQAAVDYLAEELQEVSWRMAGALGAPIDEHRLREAIDAGNRARALLAEFARRRAARELAIPGADALAVLIAFTTMLPDEFTQALAALMAQPPAGEPGDAVPVVLSGVTFDNIDLARTFEDTGLYLIADDLSTGSRLYTVQVGDGDPWQALARAYLTKPPCSVKEPSAARADHLLAQVGASGAAGVVFYLTRFCDTEQVEWPFLRDRLAAEGIPVVLIEGEHRAAGLEQVRTRLEAFREQLEALAEVDDGEGQDGGSE